MLHTFSLGKAYLGNGWAIHPLSGSLLKTSVESVNRFRSSRFPSSVITALEQCDDPYLLAPSLSVIGSPETQRAESSDSSLKIQSQLKRLKFWRAFNFYAAILYASVPAICFQKSSDAFASLNQLHENETCDSCLEKCLAIAKCSASFREKGVLFIGAHLPLEAMHAWVIEDGHQPDEEDRQWVNFQPLFAITCEKKLPDAL